MLLSRRQFLRTGAAAGGTLLVSMRFGALARAQEEGPPLVDAAALEKYVDPLPIPPTWTGDKLAARGLRMAESVHRFHRDLGETPTWGYGGASYLGPTISVRRGEPVTFSARNRLDAHLLGVDSELHGPHDGDDQDFPRTSLHLHGGYTEPASDGYPEDRFGPGRHHVYDYTNDQQAGTLWFHDHALGITRLNVYAGLAGFFLLRDEEAEMGLPPRPFEIPLVLQDKAFLEEDDGTNPLYYPSPWEPEFFGNAAVVNGKAWPRKRVRRAIYRLRLLNGSSSRIYNLFLDPQVPMWQVGTESGLLGAPVPVTRILLAPGERADVLVDFRGRSPDDQVKLMNDDLPPGVVSPADVEIEELMLFTVARQRGFSGGIPEAFSPVTRMSDQTPVRRRNLLLTEILDEEGEPVMALLNARLWDTADIEEPEVDTLEQWNLINLTADTHPIHLHLIQFQLHNRQPIDAERYLVDVFGKEELGVGDVGTGPWPHFPSPDGYTAGGEVWPKPQEAGWKDTIQAHPGTVTRILVPFGPNAAPGVPFGWSHRAAPFTGEYVWHCHILDHEDNEMMLPYRVVRA